MANDYEAHVISGDAATDLQIIIMMLQDRKYVVVQTIQHEADEDTELHNVLARAGWQVIGSPTMGIVDSHWIVNVVPT